MHWQKYAKMRKTCLIHLVLWDELDPFRWVGSVEAVHGVLFGGCLMTPCKRDWW